MTEERVRKYYSDHVRGEWKRLNRDAYHRLEFETALYFLEKYLPKRGRILDAGGGPGRYTIELAKRGFKVTLLDLAPANLEFAARQIKRPKVRHRISGVVEGSIADLSRFPSDYFDAVLSLGGPLSHVMKAEKRGKAISELIRVAKPGAPIFISVMSRLSVLVVVLTQFPHEIELPQFKRMRNEGNIDGTTGFTACHFFLPEELRKALKRRNVRILEMAGLEGLGSRHSPAIDQLAQNPRRWKTWRETHFQTCAHPAVVGMSEHILAVCRKNRSRD